MVGSRYDSEDLVTVAILGDDTSLLGDQSRGYVWGQNDNGQLGLGDTKDRCEPTSLGQHVVRHAAAGQYNTLILTGE